MSRKVLAVARNFPLPSFVPAPEAVMKSGLPCFSLSAPLGAETEKQRPCRRVVDFLTASHAGIQARGDAAAALAPRFRGGDDTADRR